LGWTEERFRRSSLFEYNLAVAGYWRNWERNTAWLMRNIIFYMVAGNPYIDKHNKPVSPQKILKLSDDKETEEKTLTPEELEATRQELLNLMK
jgi:hypothetical protein